jgi:hypothetical protein
MNVRATTIATIATALAALTALPAAPAFAADRPASAIHQTAGAHTSVNQLVGTPVTPAGRSIQLPHNARGARSAAAQSSGKYQGVDMSITATGSVGLQFVTNDITADHDSLPTNIENGGTTHLQMWQNADTWYGAYGTSTARIYDHGKATDFWVKMYASVWYYPYDKGSCQIYQGDPAVTGKQVDFSPYTCGVTSVDHSDPWKIAFTIGRTPATVVSDPTTQSALLKEACDGPNAAQDCFYIPTSVTFIPADPQPYGDPVNNTTDETVDLKVSKTHTVGTEDSIGIDYTTKLTLWKVWSNSLSVSYDHTWTDTRDFTQAESMKVPAFMTGWFTISPVLDQITGDFIVRYNGNVYAISGATVTMPDATKNAIITPNLQAIDSLPLAPVH